MTLHPLIAIAAALLAAAPTAAQSQAEVPPSPVVAVELPQVTLDTDLGPVVVELDTVHAPVTAGNFLRYVKEKRFDGMSFYRAVNVADGYGLVQGGTQGDPKKTLPPIAHEPTTQTGLTHTDVTLSMARAAPGSATGDFFIIVGNLTSLDAGSTDTAGTGDTLGFAAFGHVVSGMDVVHRILAAPTSPTAGEGAMIGQMLAPKITIRTARVTPAAEVPE
ncbi:peptidylprolyl isomerase [Sphingorhabdus soli]|uniref:peptidylprolyl isomerase n=1 Tax=Flavisphingopyxis soli TaxID=2601267 RepID=A0A5C6U9H3_9SPHN|nr:peptidylprolyl isomerase [Sphingorhabdus soli]TXC68285.1 peptidylprolyl isomerase [Sphingorhabdus soli]